MSVASSPCLPISCIAVGNPSAVKPLGTVILRDMPAGEAEHLRRVHSAYLASMHEMASQAYEQARSDKARLKVISMALGLMEREAKLLGLDAEMRNHHKPPPDRSQVQPTVWSLIAKAEPTDLETLKRIQELDPIEKPHYAKSADDPGPVDD
jgi:hypothetical protein